MHLGAQTREHINHTDKNRTHAQTDFSWCNSQVLLSVHQGAQFN